MRRILTLLVALTVLAVLSPGDVSAQDREPVRIGMDVGIGVRLNNPATFFADLPITRIRAGFRLSDRFGLEPAIGFSLVTNEDGHETNVGIGLDAQFFTSARVYLAGGLGLGYVSTDAELVVVDAFGRILGSSVVTTSGSQVNVRAAVGLNQPATNYLDFRLEGRYVHTVANSTFFSGNFLIARAGLSILIR